MTGTSLDGLDAALAEVRGTGLDAAARLLGLVRRPLGSLAARFASGAIDLVAAHGQTICHAHRRGLTLQLLDPWPIARRLRVPVVHDLRRADLAAGGEGAPITPLADWVLFRSTGEDRTVVNLGGIANLTLLPAGASARSRRTACRSRFPR